MRQNLSFRFAAGLIALGFVVSSGFAADPKSVDFAHDIVPLIKDRCAKCHTNGTYKGSFSLDTRQATLKSKAVVPGKSEESELVARLLSDDPEEQMPPKGKGERLTVAEVALFRGWIDQGMRWEEGFTFKQGTYVAPLKLKQVELPPARDGRDHPIDRIVDANLAEHQVARPPAIDDATFLRRIDLDLSGILPKPEALEAFLNDSSGDKRARQARRLLDDKEVYAEHWLTFWNDLLRNDYKGTGYIDGGRKQITGWLYQSLVENTPFDRFVYELISPTAESEGFINGIKWRGRVNASQVPEIQFSQNVSQVFFGINMKCASCHDSFIDRWKLDDAYGLAAIIAEQPLEIHRCDKPTGRMAEPKFMWPELGSIDPSLSKSERLAQLARLVTDKDNGRFSRTIANRIWQRLMGRGIVHPVDVMANEPWSEDLLDYLAGYLVDHKYDLKALIEHIVTAQTYQSRPAVLKSEALGDDDYVFRGPEVRRMTAEQYLDAVWAITGAGPSKPDAPVKGAAARAAESKARPKVRASMVNSDLLMRSLGRPNREQVVTTRGDVLTTLQALDLSNGQILTDLVTQGAANLLKAQPEATADHWIESIYLQSLSRRPSDGELTTARELVGLPATPEGLADLLWVVFVLPEFQLIR
ncbi:Planctomycete cytochrome C [Singulisphaera sp. GP187]|uniref:PSD1 and planctomycete cytochrome C domain-containing protein n=1 Tax=Singulisphaera sp. GP187 TaxID=1882752 RepID=UPI0009293A2E|nr:PSD1 and planctomycete cytochrome C domain-containing protein [Singulisphaera sp. GP187]SIO22933.1 Planctomycete cytochrome C [Singulisphaera sp. GP187]